MFTAEWVVFVLACGVAGFIYGRFFKVRCM